MHQYLTCVMLMLQGSLEELRVVYARKTPYEKEEEY
jgi:hypothetical protein